MLLQDFLLVALFSPLSTYADQIAITDLPLYNEATIDVRDCVYTEQSDFISTYGCTVTDPAECLCSNATSSYHVASAISSCIEELVDWDMGRSEIITATEIFASYCLTNAGISARDQTLLQDFALYSRAPANLGFCAKSISSSYSTALGCDFYTPAECLCGDSQTSTMIQSAMLSCASDELNTPQLVASTITELWSSYCSANLATTATRSIEAVTTEPGSAATAAASSAAPSAAPSTPMNTATGTQSGSSTFPTAKPPTSGSASSSSSSSGSGLSLGAEIGLAVGCAFGAALLTTIATWWKPAQARRATQQNLKPHKLAATLAPRPDPIGQIADVIPFFNTKVNTALPTLRPSAPTLHLIHYMPPPWILTSPASRGIGLHLTRHLLRTTPLPIIATARTDLSGTRARILDGLDVDPQRLEVLQLDVTDERTISLAASHCRARFPDTYLHLAFCLPGILHPEKAPAQIEHAHALETFQINTLGPLLLAKHFLPFLPRKATALYTPAPPSTTSAAPSPLAPAATFALMSARVGSIADNAAGGWYSYRASKAAVNQLVKSFDIYLRQSAGAKARCVGLHPGTVRTGLSREFWKSTPSGKLFEPEWVAERLVEVVRGVGPEGRGRCWDWKGEEIPP
ncbi:hypothetical protein MMC15_000246 [Xylographa vitiligo]|nr:hypothetical protein [Xylographa vitiligo]